MHKSYKNELSRENLKDFTRSSVKWSYLGDGKINATCKWSAKPYYHSISEDNKHRDFVKAVESPIFSPTFAAGDDSELRWEIEMEYSRSTRYFYAKLNFFELNDRVSYVYSMSLLEKNLKPREFKKFDDRPLTDEQTPKVCLGVDCIASRLEPDYSNYLREGKIFTMIVGIVAELSEPPKSPLLINLESRTLSNEKIPLEFHDFEKLLKEGLLSDITLKIHGERLKVHKNILASRSPRFLEMFANVDAGKSELEIKDFNYISMKEMLRFVYTGQVRDLGELHAKQLLKIANKFAIASLLPKTQDLLCKYLNVGNAVEMLKLADTYGADRVKNEAMSIIMNNMQKIDETNLMTLKPELLTRILLGVSKMNDKLVKSRDMLI